MTHPITHTSFAHQQNQQQSVRFLTMRYIEDHSSQAQSESQSTERVKPAGVSRVNEDQ